MSLLAIANCQLWESKIKQQAKIYYLSIYKKLEKP